MAGAARKGDDSGPLIGEEWMTGSAAGRTEDVRSREKARHDAELFERVRFSDAACGTHWMRAARAPGPQERRARPKRTAFVPDSLLRAADAQPDSEFSVVEDETAVRTLVDSMLELQGYRVLSASSAGEALELSAAHGGRIHLLLTDVDIPDTSDRELAQRLRADRADMRLLYMSGQAEVDVIEYGVLTSGALFLAKPFTIRALTHRVREVLDNQSW
jgi:CheY-like chemotaxis protein